MLGADKPLCTVLIAYPGFEVFRLKVCVTGNRIPSKLLLNQENSSSREIFADGVKPRYIPSGFT